MAMFYGFAAVCLFGGAMADIYDETLSSVCPKIETPSKFNMTRYLGRWYEAERYFVPYETNVKCGTADFSVAKNSRIEMTQSWISVDSEEHDSITAIVRVLDLSDPAKFQIRIPSRPSTEWTDYWILGTDYDSYAIVYNCKIVNDSSTTHAWIFTRKRHPSETVIAKALRIAEKHTLEGSKFMITDQTDCKEK